jgi:8-oxo-dGTP pyrophosphatase MutT (NUDIX family)
MDNTGVGGETAPFREALKRYRHRYPDECSVVDRFLRLLDQGRRAFGRENLDAHFTGSAVIVNKARTHVLLTHHVKLDMWLQLGGHADGDTDLHRVALREAVEESGLPGEAITFLAARTEERSDDNRESPITEVLDIDIHPIPSRGEVGRHYHYDVRYLFSADDRHPLVLSDESHDLKWVPLDRLDRYTGEASLARALAKARGQV